LLLALNLLEPYPMSSPSLSTHALAAQADPVPGLALSCGLREALERICRLAASGLRTEGAVVTLSAAGQELIGAVAGQPLPASVLAALCDAFDPAATALIEPSETWLQALPDSSSVCFLASASLASSSGHHLGRLIVHGLAPRALDEAERRQLLDLAALGSSEVSRGLKPDVAPALMAVRRIADSLVGSQVVIVRERDRTQIFESLLMEMVKLTGSDVGFLGEVHELGENLPSLQVQAMHDSSAGLDFSLDNTDEDSFHRRLEGLQRVFDAALGSGEAIVCDQASHPGVASLTWGHQTLSGLISVPIRQGDSLVALLGLGCFERPFEPDILARLKPLLVVIGQLVRATRVEGESKRLQAELTRLSRVASETTNGVIITDARGQIEWVNAGFTRITGYRLEEVIGLKPGRVLQGPGTDAAEVAIMREALAQGRGFLVDVLNYNAQGRPYWINVSCNALHDEHGRLQGFMAIETDITARKEAEKAIIQARMEAEAANRSKSDFLANMSHEIRTPMNAVLGMSHLLLQTPLDRKQIDFVTKIQDSGQHLLGVINDILDFSKVEAGKIDVEHIDMDLEKVLDNVANLVGSKAAAKDLDLLFDVAPDVPTQLVGDPLRLGQILINYANNAVKFTERGDVSIQVTKLSETDGTVVLRFSVSDTGIGLAAEQLELLFQSFHQADSSTTRKYGGTGLGLAISKRLAELMGGEVGANSEPGQGSQFWFTARLGKSGTARTLIQPEPDLRGKRLLVVDDNPHVRALMTEQLKRLNFDVQSADSAAQALVCIDTAAAGAQPFDLALIDQKMPGMNGLQLFEAIRRSQGGAHLPAVLVSGDVRAEIRLASLEAGMQGVLHKPFNASVLFDAVMQALGRRPLRNPAPREDTFSVVPTGTHARAMLQGLSVLLVEDNEVNQEVAIGMLRLAGLQVDTANNGREALSMIGQRPYDLVLMDMQMPVMDGLTCTRELRRMEAHKSLPVIAMTANARATDRQACLDAGMVDFVSKPIEPEELWRALLRWAPVKIRPQPITGPVAESTEPESQAVLHIAGLDVGQGLRRAIGNIPLYLSLLRKFSAGQRLVPQQISQAIDSKDWARAELLAHTLKGVAGNIGAHAIQHAAADLENAVAEQSEGLCRAQLMRLSEQLNPLLDQLDAQLGAQSIGPVSSRSAPDESQPMTAASSLSSRPASASAAVPVSEETMDQKALVLVVDDTPENLQLMSAVLKDDYKVKVASKGERALQIAQGSPAPDIILLDVMMPGMDGYEVCRRLKQNPATAQIPVLFLTAKTDSESETTGFECGGVDYIAKPISPPVVLARVHAQLQLKRMADFLRDKNDFLSHEVALRTREVSAIQDVTILAMSSMAETRDNETGNHILRTQRYVRCLAEKLQQQPRYAAELTDHYVHQLYKSAPLHDIGKVGIPDHILLKPGKLTVEEFEIMKTHTTIGFQAIERAEKSLGIALDFLKPAKEIALYHQEKWDGSGYPEGLAGEAIPLSARLMALADVYDALISRRVYKGAMTHEEAMVILHQGRGSHFDPNVFDAFLEVEEDFRRIAMSLSDPE
jgi:two-component system sensor histidine kinase/response regulator